MSNYRSRYSWRLKSKAGWARYVKRLKPRIHYGTYCYRFHYWYQLSDYRLPVLYHPTEGENL